MFKDVFEFSHVAAIIVRHEHIEHLPRHRRDALAQFVVKLAQKIANETRYVVAPFAQRRQTDLNDVETKKKVLPKTMRIDFGAQIAVGGRNDPRGHRFLAHIPDALRLLFLYDAQQFDLHRHGQLADFVEEDRPLRGGLKKPDLVTHRASKCAARMTKKLALQQGFRNGPTVDGHKRSRRSAQLVDGARDDFLSSTGFPGDENVGFGGCHASDKAHHFLHGVGLTDEVGQALGFGPVGWRGRPQKGNAPRMRLGDEGQDFVAFERLFDVIKGAAAHGLNGRRRRRIRGDKEHLNARIRALDGMQHIESCRIRKTIVGQDDVNFPRLGRNIRHGFLTTRKPTHFMTRASQHEFCHLQDVDFIFYENDARHRIVPKRYKKTRQ